MNTIPIVVHYLRKSTGSVLRVNYVIGRKNLLNQDWMTAFWRGSIVGIGGGWDYGYIANMDEVQRYL